MKYYVMAPAKIHSGGPRLCHQMCYELTEQGQESYMYYFMYDDKEAMPVDTDCNERYVKYNTLHVTNKEDVDVADAVVIMAEDYTCAVPCFKQAKKVLWWMSVDNYIKSSQEADMATIKEQVDVHLVQSRYAYSYLTEKWNIPIEKVMYVSDYIDEQFGTFIFPASHRENIALYNPKKGLQDLQPLMERTPWLKWIALLNLTEEQMILLMEYAKIYVDFGNHPGKDRIPREAASCGCCVITNKKGSAAFKEDVPIPECYKFENVAEDYDKIAEFLRVICENYEEHFMQFEGYRSMIRGEKQKFYDDVRQFVACCEQWDC